MAAAIVVESRSLILRTLSTSKPMSRESALEEDGSLSASPVWFRARAFEQHDRKRLTTTQEIPLKATASLLLKTLC